jgi:hypothetical protein
LLSAKHVTVGSVAVAGGRPTPKTKGGHRETSYRAYS